jgi:glycosyltransferase involved in cell wall biosynthesis
MFSVIIPTYNRKEALERTLGSILSLNIRSEFEIIIVNDYPEFKLSGFEDKRISVINNVRNLGRSASRNAGADAAKGNYLFFIDDDIEVKEDVFSRHIEKLDSGYDAVFSNVKNVRTDRSYSVLNEYLNTRGANKKGFENNFKSNYFTSAFCSIKRDFFKRIGGFDEKFEGYGWEDPELGLRIEANSGQIGFVKTGGLIHYHDKEVSEWVSQLENSGKNLNYLIEKHPRFKKLIRYGLLTSALGAIAFNPLFYAVEKHKAKTIKGFFGFISLNFLFYAAIRRALKQKKQA